MRVLGSCRSDRCGVERPRSSRPARRSWNLGHAHYSWRKYVCSILHSEWASTCLIIRMCTQRLVRTSRPRNARHPALVATTVLQRSWACTSRRLLAHTSRYKDIHLMGHGVTGFLIHMSCHHAGSVGVDCRPRFGFRSADQYLHWARDHVRVPRACLDDRDGE